MLLPVKLLLCMAMPCPGMTTGTTDVSEKVLDACVHMSGSGA